MLKSQPDSLDELLKRCAALAGQSIGDLYTLYNAKVPLKLLHAKGKTGQLIERYLGATANSLALPDFPNLGVELKTLPINNNQPSESTYVCHAPLFAKTANKWEDSWVKHKLSCVLWIPIESSPNIPIYKRRIGNCKLWRPSTTEEAILRTDWELLTQKLWFGEIDSLNANYGEALQIRPKAASGKILSSAYSNNKLIKTVPKGFYLRKSFTSQLLKNYHPNI